MGNITGKSVSKGIVYGTARWMDMSSKQSTDDMVKGTPEEEWNKFIEAREKIVNKLKTHATQVGTFGEASLAGFLEMYVALAEDVFLESGVKEKVFYEDLSAVEAIDATGTVLIDSISDMDDEFTKSRIVDISDVMNRISEEIYGYDATEGFTNGDYILIAEDISPARLFSIINNIKGVILTEGNEEGHAAILSRMRGIPMVIGAGDEIKKDLDGKKLILDADSGIVILEENEKEAKKYLEQAISKENKEELKKYRKADAITKYGKRIEVCCNIYSDCEAVDCMEVGADGVGLYRSEFLFLDRDSAPTEEEQFESYKNTLQAMSGKKVIIRTCDLGSDKLASYLKMPVEPNPALGIKGIRVWFDHPQLFKTQLKALYRASVYGKLMIMFPMITNVWEIRRIKDMCKDIRKELRDKNIAFDESVPLGIVIETPAAALISDELAKEVDFFSIGTNDLIQYTMATDRMNNYVVSQYMDINHNAIKKLVNMVVEAAKDNDIPIGICGDLAADEHLTEFFVKAGIDVLSVGISQVLDIKKKICNIE